MFAKTVITAAIVAVASAATCPDTEISKLLPIASNSNLSTCTNDSGYNLLTPSGLPTSEQTAKMCASSACKSLITAVIALNPTDCDLTIGSTTINVYTLTHNFDSSCAALSTTAPPASTTAAPSTTTASPATTTAAPSTTTAAPSTTTAAPSITTAAPSTTTATPTTTTTTPTVTPTTGSTTSGPTSC